MPKGSSILLFSIGLMFIQILLVHSNDGIGRNCSYNTSQPFVTIRYENDVQYQDFTSLYQLNFYCDFLYLFKVPINFSEIFNFNIDFNEMRVLNETIDLSFLNASRKFRFWFSFQDLKGFDIEMDGPIVRYHSGSNNDKIFFGSCEVKFYYRKNLIDEHLCSVSVLDKTEIYLFSNLSQTEIYFYDNNYFRDSICPYAFKNANVNKITLQKPESSIINQLSLSFLPLKHGENDTVDLNCSINILSFDDSYRLSLNHALINPFVFGNLLELHTDGMLASIQDELFRTFKRLESVSLSFENIREFLHSSQNKWLEHVFHQAQEFDVTDMMIDYLDPS